MEWYYVIGLIVYFVVLFVGAVLFLIFDGSGWGDHDAKANWKSNLIVLTFWPLLVVFFCLIMLPFDLISKRM